MHEKLIGKAVKKTVKKIELITKISGQTISDWQSFRDMITEWLTEYLIFRMTVKATVKDGRDPDLLRYFKKEYRSLRRSNKKLNQSERMMLSIYEIYFAKKHSVFEVKYTDTNLNMILAISEFAEGILPAGY